jgi:hypothetical protein
VRLFQHAIRSLTTSLSSLSQRIRCGFPSDQCGAATEAGATGAAVPIGVGGAEDVFGTTVVIGTAEGAATIGPSTWSAGKPCARRMRASVTRHK